MDRRNIVIARYKEDISWANAYDNVFIVQKGEHMDNIGREPASYLWYIIENYDNLEGKYFFLQGNPKEHCPWIERELDNTERDFRWFSDRSGLTCDMNARPQDNINLTEFLSDCGIEYKEKTITFNGCCLFMISSDKLLSKPKEYYERILEATIKKPRSCYAFERCVELIFN